jgi:cell division protein FtsZ
MNASPDQPSFTQLDASPGAAPVPAPAATSAASAAPPVRLFAVGGAGLNVLKRLASDPALAACAVAVRAEGGSRVAPPVAETLALHNLPSSGLVATSADRIRAAVVEQAPRIKALCAGAKVVGVVTGLGGHLGTLAAPALAALARETGAFVLAFAAMPFECEGSLRMRTAEAGLLRLKESADLVVCQPNQRLIPLMGENTSLVDTFNTTNSLFAAAITAACQGFASETVIGLPLADLCELVRQHSNECAWVAGEARGPNRGAEAADRLLVHPVFEGGALLKTAPLVAVSLAADASLTMAEVSRLMDRIHSELPGVPIVMGAALRPELADRLRISFMVASPELLGNEQASTAEQPAGCGASRPLETNNPLSLLSPGSTARPASRFVPPPPAATAQTLDHLRRQRKPVTRLRQGQLPLEIISKGRFEKSEPTIHQGEDLDIPTYIRRHVSLN